MFIEHFVFFLSANSMCKIWFAGCTFKEGKYDVIFHGFVYRNPASDQPKKQI